MVIELGEVQFGLKSLETLITCYNSTSGILKELFLTRSFANIKNFDDTLTQAMTCLLCSLCKCGGYRGLNIFLFKL